jgi:hypothetical protein
MKKTILALTIILSLTSTAIFASNDIIITGKVTAKQSVTVVDSNTDPSVEDLSNLGESAISDQKVGQITIDSNQNGGFKISFSSARSGYLGLESLSAGTEASHQKIGYTISLSDSGLSGTLGSGLSVSTLTGLNPEGGVVNFTAGSDVAPTVAKQYDIQVSTGTNDLESGSYDDTLTITIASL